MALGTITKVAGGPGTGDPLFCDIFHIQGDDSYSGGTADFTAAIREITGDRRQPLFVHGLGLNAGHELTYDPETDKLHVVVKSTGVEATGDLSANTYHLLVVSK